MKKLLLLITLSLLMMACSASGPMYLPIDDALNSELGRKKLDPRIKLSFGKGKINGTRMDTLTSVTKTNNVGKLIEKTCQESFISSLVYLQQSARTIGASQVVNIHSHYKDVTFWSDEVFYCIGGHSKSAVGLIGTIVE